MCPCGGVLARTRYAIGAGLGHMLIFVAGLEELRGLSGTLGCWPFHAVGPAASEAKTETEIERSRDGQKLSSWCFFAC